MTDYEHKNLEQWNRSLQKASSGEFARQAGEWLEQSGKDFLDLVREELIHSGGIDTENLLSSSEKERRIIYGSLKTGTDP